MHKTAPQSDLLLNRLLTALGKGDASGAERAAAERSMQEVRHEYEHRSEAYAAVQEQRSLLRKFLALKAELRELRQQLEPLGNEIWLAGWIGIHAPEGEASVLADRESARAFELDFEDLMNPERIKKADEIEELSIRHHIERSADYRKDPLRKFLIEPFLLALHSLGVVASPRDLPLSHMTDALFDWIGIEQRRRPTNANIWTIARDVERRLSEIDDEYDERVRRVRESSAARRSKN